MSRKPKIGFVFFVEDYQTWHMAAFAAAMHRCDWAETTSYYHYPETARTLNEVYSFLKAPTAEIRALKKPFYTGFLNAIGSNNPAKKAVLRLNKAVLSQYDVLISTENTLSYLQEFDIKMPPMIMIEHGAMGGCKVLDDSLRKRFEKIFFDSQKTVEQCLKRGAITQEQAVITGYQKIELCDALQKANPFSRPKPFILYNAHTRFKMCSLNDFLFPIAKAVAHSDTYDLIVAPHAKFQKMKFSQRFRLLKKLIRRKLPHVSVDLASQNLINMRYTGNAAIYIGDISSQIYEFLRFPRPCIFLNPSKTNWENDPDLAFWHCGEVVSDPNEIAAAIERAPARHKEFLPAQKKLMEGLFEKSFPPPSENAVKALKIFLKEKGFSL